LKLFEDFLEGYFSKFAKIMSGSNQAKIDFKRFKYYKLQMYLYIYGFYALHGNSIFLKTFTTKQ